MSVRVPGIACLAFSLCISACSSNGRDPDGPLPRLDAPAELSAQDEILYLVALFARYQLALIADPDARLDSWRHVSTQAGDLLRDFGEWSNRWENHEIFKDRDARARLVALSPEIEEFKEPREKAVVLGVMAHSIWRRNPAREYVTIEDLHDCSRYRNYNRCPIPVDTRILQRAMLIGAYADRKLYKRLLALQTHHEDHEETTHEP